MESHSQELQPRAAERGSCGAGEAAANLSRDGRGPAGRALIRIFLYSSIPQVN